MSSLVILGARSPTTYLLINQLLQSFAVSLVIFERPPLHSRVRLLQRRRQRLGSWPVLQQLLFLAWDRFSIRPASDATIRTLLAGHDVTSPDSRVQTMDVPNINAPEIVHALRESAPTCGIVSGTSLLRPPVIATAPLWVNIHCGITPRYRGVHGAFWAVYEGRPDLAGVTIHQLDAGLDTGGIIAQDTVNVERTDTYRTLPVKQYLAGIPLMIKAMQNALTGNLTTYQRTDLESKLWYSPTVAEYYTFRRQLAAIART